MEFLRNISIYNQNLLDCFEEKGYKGEVIGVYNPEDQETIDLINNYNELGFKFLIYNNKSVFTIFSKKIKVETDFRKFYKKIDMFIINSLDDYHLLIEDLTKIKETIFIVT